MAGIKVWVKAAGVRAIKTFAQAAVSVLSMTGMGVIEADWLGALSAATMAAIISLLNSVDGLPEIRVASDD